MLTNYQKKSIKNLVQEVSRRCNLKLNNYNCGQQIHQKQLDFHKCQSKNRWVFGGNRTGKTECGAVEAIWLLRGIHPFRQNKKNVCGWAVSLSTQVQRDVAQSKILSYLPKQWIADIVMLSGKKENKAEKNFRAQVLILCGVMKNHRMIFIWNVK